jgi:hypothetical protein
MMMVLRFLFMLRLHTPGITWKARNMSVMMLRINTENHIPSRCGQFAGELSHRDGVLHWNSVPNMENKVQILTLMTGTDKRIYAMSIESRRISKATEPSEKVMATVPSTWLE